YYLLYANYIVARWLSCLHCLHCRLTARRSWVRFPHGVLLALGGRSSPECTVLKWAISQAFLCGVCMFSPCPQGVSSTKNPNRKKHAKQQNTCPSLTKDGQFTSLGPRAPQPAHCSWLPWRKDSPGRDKCRGQISLRPLRHACVCVSCVATQNARVLLCVVLCDHNKRL